MNGSAKIIGISLFLGAVVVSLVIINSKLSKEIEESLQPIPIPQAAPAAAQVSAPPKAGQQPTLIDAFSGNGPQEQKNAQSTKPTSKSEKKIIYELPLDDVILVQ